MGVEPKYDNESYLGDLVQIMVLLCQKWKWIVKYTISLLAKHVLLTSLTVRWHCCSNQKYIQL